MTENENTDDYAERLLTVAHYIRHHEKSFDMGDVFGDTIFRGVTEAADKDGRADQWHYAPLRDYAVAMAHDSCGTTACIAGWALALYPELIPEDAAWESWDEVASDILGLDVEKTTELNGGLFYNMDLTAEQAADRLESYAKEFKDGLR